MYDFTVGIAMYDFIVGSYESFHGVHYTTAKVSAHTNSNVLNEH